MSMQGFSVVLKSKKGRLLWKAKLCFLLWPSLLMKRAPTGRVMDAANTLELRKITFKFMYSFKCAKLLSPCPTYLMLLLFNKLSSHCSDLCVVVVIVHFTIMYALCVSCYFGLFPLLLEVFEVFFSFGFTSIVWMIVKNFGWFIWKFLGFRRIVNVRIVARGKMVSFSFFYSITTIAIRKFSKF